MRTFVLQSDNGGRMEYERPRSIELANDTRAFKGSARIPLRGKSNPVRHIYTGYTQTAHLARQVKVNSPYRGSKAVNTVYKSRGYTIILE